MSRVRPAQVSTWLAEDRPAHALCEVRHLGILGLLLLRDELNAGRGQVAVAQRRRLAAVGRLHMGQEHRGLREAAAEAQGRGLIRRTLGVLANRELQPVERTLRRLPGDIADGLGTMARGEQLLLVHARPEPLRRDVTNPRRHRLGIVGTAHPGEDDRRGREGFGKPEARVPATGLREGTRLDALAARQQVTALLHRNVRHRLEAMLAVEIILLLNADPETLRFDAGDAYHGRRCIVEARRIGNHHRVNERAPELDPLPGVIDHHFADFDRQRIVFGLDLDESALGHAVIAIGTGDRQGHVVGAGLFVDMGRIAFGAGLSVAEVPGYLRDFARGQILEDHAQRCTADAVGGVEVCDRGRTCNRHEIGLGYDVGSAGTGNFQRNRIGPRLLIGPNRL